MMGSQTRIVALCLFLITFYVVEGNVLSHAMARALKRTMFEQEVEDQNAIHRADNHLVRRLIVMPLTDAFNPHQANGMHGKVQYGDKCSLPASIGREIFEKPYEVPWIFEIKPVRDENEIPKKARRLGSSDEEEVQEANKCTSTDEDMTKKGDDKTIPNISSFHKVLDKAYISPLDFRSPENYIFLPRWMMKNLNLTVDDVVDVSFVRIKLAALVTLTPLTLAWDDLVRGEGVDPTTILEHEVNKYSSLTAGSTIAIEYKGIEYPLYVKETKAEGGVAVRGVRVQDSDIKVDIDCSFLELQKKKLKKEQMEREEEEATSSRKLGTSGAGTSKGLKSNSVDIDMNINMNMNKGENPMKKVEETKLGNKLNEGEVENSEEEQEEEEGEEEDEDEEEDDEDEEDEEED